VTYPLRIDGIYTFEQETNWILNENPLRKG
jgi:hypothetical protein